MKIDLSKVDVEQFHVKSFNGLNLIVPKTIGVKWTKEALKFRSSVWNDEGELVSASFPKFFNWGEASTLIPVPTNIENCNLVAKVDGSTLIVSKYHDKLIIRTRGTIDAYQQQNGFEIDILKEKYPKAFDNQWLNDGYSMIYEWVTPNNRIVLLFEEVDIFLTGMIDHDNYKLVEQMLLDEIGAIIEVKRPRVYSFTDIENMIEEVKLFKGVEGICVYSNADQTIHKVKGDDYLIRHKLKSEVGSYEKLVDWFIENCSETIDDKIIFNENYIEVLSKLENEIDYETMMECKGMVSKILDTMKAVDKITIGFDAFITKILHVGTRKEQAAMIQQAYGNTNRCGMVFKLLDNRPLVKDELKKLFWQVSKK